MGLQLTHQYHDRLKVSYRGQPLFDYVYNADDIDPYSYQRPYIYPVHSTDGDLVSIFRTIDHPWHLGISMTLTVVNDQNFWGGNTYIPESQRHAIVEQGLLARPETNKYNPDKDSYALLENVGKTDHIAWDSLECSDMTVTFQEQLVWITSRGESWFDELRKIECSVINDEYWTINWQTHLKNISGEVLNIGSPTTLGRPNAGYGGLFWRGPRSYLNGDILADNGLTGEDVMGKAAPWIAYIGQHDDSLRHSTLIFRDSPQNIRYPNKWFVRNNPYGCVSFAFMFDEEYPLQPDDSLNLQYQVIIATGKRSRSDIETILNAIPL